MTTPTVETTLAALHSAHPPSLQFTPIASYIAACPKRGLEQLILIVRLSGTDNANRPVDQTRAYSAMANMMRGFELIQP